MRLTDEEKLKRYRAMLGVSGSAGAKELKEAYHGKVLKLHPDAHPEDPMAAEAFKKINVAYEFLKKHARAAGRGDGAGKKKEEECGSGDGGNSEVDPVRSAPAPAKTPAGVTLEDLVFRLKNSQNVYVRMHAARAIGAAGGKEAVWALLEALGDGSPLVALEAAAALGEVKARIAVVPLIGLHRKSGGELKERIEAALEKIGSPAAARFLDGVRGAVKGGGEGGGAAAGFPGKASESINA